MESLYTKLHADTELYNSLWRAFTFWAGGHIVLASSEKIPVMVIQENKIEIYANLDSMAEKDTKPMHVFSSIEEAIKTLKEGKYDNELLFG